MRALAHYLKNQHQKEHCGLPTWNPLQIQEIPQQFHQMKVYPQDLHW